MGKWSGIIIAALVCSSLVFALQWSEILFNPLGDDNGKEFVELAGNESLVGCAIRDSASTDNLVLLHSAAENSLSNDTIMIIENDSFWLNASENASVYVIGSAIGNSLGNTFETLTIICHNETPLNTAYNVSELINYSEGHSIVFDTNESNWHVGPMNGTPGIPSVIDALNISMNVSTNETINVTNGTNSTTNVTTNVSTNVSTNITTNVSINITINETFGWLNWSEILFNPLGDDNGKEYVELTGNGSLQDCSIRDATSSDDLALLHNGTSDIIVILEDGSDWINATENVSVYTAGNAIGNGLGNMYESLVIVCGNKTALNTSYNTSRLQGFAEGDAIVFVNGTWLAEQGDGTPGRQNGNVTFPNITKQPPKPPKPPAPSSSGARGGIPCNQSLELDLPSKAIVGQEATLRTNAYATFEISVDNVSIGSASGTYTSITMPQGKKVKVVAYASVCGRKTHRTAYITVAQPPVAPPTPPTPPVQKGQEQASQTRSSSVAQSTSANAEQPPTPMTGAATLSVFNQDRDVVPWVCGFGIVVLSVSLVAFLKLKKEHEKPGEEALPEADAARENEEQTR